MRGAEQAQVQQAEARARKERGRMARRFGLLTEDSLDLLIELGHRDPKLALVVGRALARERDQALANQRRAEQERSMQAAKARRLGAELGYPAVDALDLGEGEDHWRAISPTRNTLWSHCLPKLPGWRKRSRRSR